MKSLLFLMFASFASFAFGHDVSAKKYLVVLKNDVSYTNLFTHFNLLNNNPTVFEFEDFKGYISNFEESQVSAVANDPAVDFIEEDQPVQNFNLQVEHNSPWGLNRVSHHEKSTCEDYEIETDEPTCSRDYLYDSNDGNGVTVFVVDTGIYADHSDFEGRAFYGPSFVGKDSKDENGHGSHCAGTIGGKTYGIAKKAKLVGVRVLDENGSGSMSGVLKGVEWVTQQQRKNSSSKMVISMSLGGGKSRVLDMAVNAAIDAGVFVSVAAGNSNEDACNSSPAGAAKVVTVGATDSEDNRSYFSNVGKCVDIFAPGSDITSVWIGDRDETNSISGTSMVRTKFFLHFIDYN